MGTVNERYLLNLACNVVGRLKIPLNFILIGRRNFSTALWDHRAPLGSATLFELLDKMSPGTLGQICSLAIRVPEENDFRTVPFKSFYSKVYMEHQVGKEVLTHYAFFVVSSAIWEILATERQIREGSVFSEETINRYSGDNDMGVDYEPSERMFEFVMNNRVDKGRSRRRG